MVMQNFVGGGGGGEYYGIFLSGELLFPWIQNRSNWSIMKWLLKLFIDFLGCAYIILAPVALESIPHFFLS